LALSDGERSSRVKIADRGFASRQSASLVPIKPGELRRFVLYDGRELCVPLERLKVDHLFNLIDLERRALGALNTINRLHLPEVLSQNSQQLALRIGQEACNQAPTMRGIAPVIPHKANEKDKPAFFARTLCKARARIEQAVGRLNCFKRVALRCEKDRTKLPIHRQFGRRPLLDQFVHTA
jgi:hypothetical protein